MHDLHSLIFYVTEDGKYPKMFNVLLNNDSFDCICFNLCWQIMDVATHTELYLLLLLGEVLS